MKRYAIAFFVLISLAWGVNHLKSPPAATMAAGEAVLTQHNDPGRTGANLQETTLNLNNVRAGSFGKLFSRAVVGQIYAQPLYVPGMNIAGGIHNVVYVATQRNNVYAFDADNPLASAPLWSVNLGQPASPIPADFGNRYGNFDDISDAVGITSTPVIDPGTNTLYVVAFIRDTPPNITCDPTSPPCSYHHALFALDITTGATRIGPITIAGSVNGTGYDSIGGVVTFNSHQQLQRSSLLLSNGVVYVAFASYADTDPYHGWVFGYRAADLSLASIFNSTPNGQEGGIWMSGEGLSADADGSLYLITGNGTFDAHTPGGLNYGDSFLKLNPGAVQNGLLPVVDWFTPFNQADLAAADQDLGSTGPLLIPGTSRIAGGGKEGKLYLVDRTNLGRFNGPGGPDLVLQSFPVLPVTSLFNSPVFWNSANTPMLYIWGVAGPLVAYNFSGGLLDVQHPLAGSTVLSQFQAYPGAALSLSANGNDPNTGILWASHPVPNSNLTQGVLRAYNASNITQELWNSDANPSNAVLGFAKFNAPTVANGKVYLGTSSGQLLVYGLQLNNSTYFPLINK